MKIPVPLDQPLAVGDRFASKYPAITVHHKVVALKPGKVRLQVLGHQVRGSDVLPDAAGGYRFWLDLDTVTKYWLPKRYIINQTKGAK